VSEPAGARVPHAWLAEIERAAALGLSCVASTATIVNVAVKPIGRRRRPDLAGAGVPDARQVELPRSRAFPSGHTAAAVVFATGVSPRAACGRSAAALTGCRRRLLARAHRRALPR
jgi:membrane-associated phospholipid phosphatase